MNSKFDSNNILQLRRLSEERIPNYLIEKNKKKKQFRLSSILTFQKRSQPKENYFCIEKIKTESSEKKIYIEISGYVTPQIKAMSLSSQGLCLLVYIII